MKGLVDKYGRKILPCIYQSITSIGDSMLGLKINGQYGIADCSGKVIMPPQFDELGYFQNGHVKVTKDSLVGLVNKKGRFVLPCRYSYLWSLKSGLIQVEAGDKCAYANKEGELLTPFIYEHAHFTDWRPAGDFSDMYEGRDGMERVKRNDKWGYINSLGKEVVPCQYDGVKTLSRGSLVGVLKDKKWGYADYNGKLVIPCRYHWINEFDEGLALVMKDCDLSKAGKQCECQDFTHYEHGLRFAVYRPGVKYYIDSIGREVIRGDFQEAFAFEHGYAWVQDWKGQWKKIDTKGRTASTYKYTAFFWPRDNGLAAVMRNRKYGFVNNAGREVIPCIYDDACKFEGDTAMVQKNGKCLVINSKGKVVREL